MPAKTNYSHQSCIKETLALVCCCHAPMPLSWSTHTEMLLSGMQVMHVRVCAHVQLCQWRQKEKRLKVGSCKATYVGCQARDALPRLVHMSSVDLQVCKSNSSRGLGSFSQIMLKKNVRTELLDAVKWRRLSG